MKEKMNFKNAVVSFALISALTGSSSLYAQSTNTVPSVPEPLPAKIETNIKELMQLAPDGHGWKRKKIDKDITEYSFWDKTTYSLLTIKTNRFGGWGYIGPMPAEPVFEGANQDTVLIFDHRETDYGLGPSKDAFEITPSSATSSATNRWKLYEHPEQENYLKATETEAKVLEKLCETSRQLPTHKNWLRALFHF